MRKLMSVLLLSGLVGITQADNSLRAGLVAGADMAVVSRFSAMSQSPFFKAMEAQMTDAERQARKAQQARILELTGLGEDDVEAFVMSVDLSGINPATMDEAFLNQIQVAAAVLLKKPITLDQLEKAIGAMKEESGGPGAQVQRIAIGGHSALKYTPAADESWDGPQQMLTGISADGKTVVLSINEDSLGSALARAGGAPAAAVSPELAEALRGLGDQQMAVALVLPRELRDQIQQQVQAMSAADPMTGMFIGPFAGVKSLLIGAKADETLDLRVLLDIGNEMAAAQLAGMFTNMAGGLAGFGQAARKMTAAAEGTVIRLTGSLTPADLKPGAPGFGLEE